MKSFGAFNSCMSIYAVGLNVSGCLIIWLILRAKTKWSFCRRTQCSYNNEELVNVWRRTWTGFMDILVVPSGPVLCPSSQWATVVKSLC